MKKSFNIEKLEEAFNLPLKDLIKRYQKLGPLDTSIKFSICTPTLNEEKYVGKLLECLTNQTYKNFEVIVSDAGSKDKTREEVLKYSSMLNLTFIVAPKKGVSSQRNYAASLAKNENLIFFDADVSPEPKFLEKIARYLSSYEADILTSWNVPISDRLADDFIYLANNLLFMEAIKKVSPTAVGTFIYANKKSFDIVGGFDENLSLAEDFDLAKRMFDHGFKYVLLRDPKILVSVRRFDKEGRINFIWKNVKGAYYYAKGGAKECKGKLKHEFGEF